MSFTRKGEMMGEAIFFGCVTLFVLFGWLRELWFYRKRNWDFTIDSGLTRWAFGTGGFPARNVSPKIRVQIGLPLWIIFGLYVTVLTYLQS
jgi:hypothetical protein